MLRYDAVIIGGGHNGLVCAAYLARAGKSVCVLERRHVLGGCASTEELWPGFHVSPAAYVVSLLQRDIIDDLKLREHGLTILPRNPSSFTPTLDGPSLLLGPDTAFNQAQIAQFSSRDAEAYPRYDALLTRVAEQLEPMLSEPAPSLPPKLRDAPRVLRLWQAMRQLGGDLRAAIELLTGAARPILERWFESEPLRATLATDAIIGAFASPSTPGSAYVLLHHVMGDAGGARGVWGYVRGGMGRLAAAIETTCTQLGARIRRESPVAHIERDDTGGDFHVTLTDGQTIAAGAVASSIDASATLALLQGRLRDDHDWSEVRTIDYQSASAKINLALSDLPDFRTGEHDRNIALRGTTHISPTLDYIECAFADALRGRPSEEPVLEITIPSTVDDTIAPPGAHVMSIFVQYAPYRLADGEWTDDRKNAFADRCIDMIARYAPNIRDIVLHRQVLTPVDLERVFGLTGGNIFQGAMTLNQLGPMRSDCRTAAPRLYLCGAATHPGGGVMGACGRNAARAMLRDGV